MSLTRRLQLVGGISEQRWLHDALKVAFATSDMQHVNQHFGAAKGFAIYALSQERICLLEAVAFEQAQTEPRPQSQSEAAAAGPLQDATGRNEDKLAEKIAALDGCIAVYSQAVGASAIGRLQAKGIQPLKAAPGTPVSELLNDLQQQMKQGRDSWLTRALRRATPGDPSRFAQMEADGWEE